MPPILQEVLESDRSLVLDADGLNILAQIGTISALSQRRQQFSMPVNLNVYFPFR